MEVGGLAAVLKPVPRKGSPQPPTFMITFGQSFASFCMPSLH